MPAPDMRAQWTDYVVGAGHPLLADVQNRLALVDHTNSGAHDAITRDDLVNNDGNDLTSGTLVVQDPSLARAFKRTTTASDTHDPYVLVADITAGDTGRVAYEGVVTINVQGNVNIGDYLRTSVTSGRAASAGTSAAVGCFARAYTSYSGGAAGQVTALLIGMMAR